MRKILVCISDAQFFLFLRHILANEGFEADLLMKPDEIPGRGPGANVAAVVLEGGRDPNDSNIWMDCVRDRLPHVPLIVFARRGRPHIPPLQQWDLLLEPPFDPAALIHFLRRLRYDHLVEPVESGTESVLEFADLRMDLAAMKVKRGDKVVPLTALQFRLLRHLLLQSTSVCNRDDLIQNCWPPDVEVELRTVDVHVGQIRRVLMEFGPDIIRTVRGSGYALDKPQDTESGEC